ncbi:MAG: hypothetical protein Q8O64_12975 [Sideroxyarcus sp.]|nr:hypothetical protein [Sideroxyarcus sp.]
MLHTLDLTGLADQNAWRLSGQFATSLLSGVRAVGEHLARHFPARSGKPNEMPDRPVVLR